MTDIPMGKYCNIVAITPAGFNPPFISINSNGFGLGVTITVRSQSKIDRFTQYPVCGDIAEISLNEEQWNDFIDQMAAKTGLPEREQPPATPEGAHDKDR